MRIFLAKPTPLETPFFAAGRHKETRVKLTQFVLCSGRVCCPELRAQKPSCAPKPTKMWVHNIAVLLGLYASVRVFMLH